ncbi:MAG: hypothetical protein J0M35_00255 [Candidatus Obscuribacter phosphatis]|uniref:Uncharacterized protein n=1 Tax=Candidatus Obscuribacter phosphatis TaxID=1906157 RepID=A0A8J7TJY4_9BACT|nr:hypothetical protein [Candidatus Obscuribacter phosphatis]
MAIIAIATGIFVFLLTGAVTNELTHDPGAGVLPGLILGFLAASPLFKLAAQERSNFLHPAPREYNIPAKLAFAKIRDYLAEVSYNYGDKWHVVTADTQSGRITANLRFTDEFTRIEGDARGNIHTRTERLQRFLAVEIQVRPTERGTTIQLDFSPRIEGVYYAACDIIVSDVISRFDSILTDKGRSL